MREAKKIKAGGRKEKQRIKTSREQPVRNSRVTRVQKSAGLPHAKNQNLAEPKMIDEPATVGTPATPTMPTLSQTSKVNSPVVSKMLNVHALPNGPHNIKVGSLVVFAVSDPSSPSKKILQTYMAGSAGKLTPVATTSSVLSSVEDYMRNGIPESTDSTNSSQNLRADE